MKKSFDESQLRPGQVDALRVIRERLEQKETHTAIVMATRYGKSDLQRIATFAAVELGLACMGISLLPTTILRDQMNNKKKWQKFISRLRITKPIKKTAIKTCVQNPSANGEIFVSTTIQFFQQNVDYWIDQAKAMTHKTGLPVLLFIDECHTQSLTNEWGKAVTFWQRETGGSVILCTATPDRTDSEMIPGFEYDEKDSTDYIEYRTRPGSTEERIRVDVWDGTRKRVEIKAHSTTGFKQAWDESVLCKVEPRWFDLNLKEIDEGSEGTLSGLRNKQEITRTLSRGLRHPIAIRGAVELFVERLRLMRKIDPKCAGIIFCGNDTETEEKEANKHAKGIAKEVLRQMSELSAPDIIIATSAEGDGAAEVARFADEEKGEGAVLIVKQMASLGLDTSRLKVGADLSPIRTRVANIQRIMRIATPHEWKNTQMLTCSWISPKDILAQAIFQSVVTNSGGEATVADLKFVRSYEKDREESPARPNHVVTGIVGAGADDSDRNTATEPELAEVRMFFDLAPEIAAYVTHPELVRRVKERNGAAAPPKDTGEEAAEIRVNINTVARDVVNKRRRSPYTQQDWERISKDAWKEVYQHCGVAKHLKLEQINDLEMLKRIHSVFQSLL